MDQLVDQRHLAIESAELSSAQLINVLLEILEDPEVRQVRHESRPIAPVDLPTATRRLLVMERGPHEINLCGILRNAAELGLEVIRHHDIAAGLNEGIDVVLIDTTCPGRNNLDLIRRLRRKDANVPIIALAALREDPLPYYRAGASDCLAIDFVTTQVLSCAIDRLFPDPS